MKTLKILHTADLLLDSPFEALPSGKASIRRSEQQELLENIAELSQSEKVDLVLLSGNLLDSRKSYYDTGEELMRALNLISAPVFISPGNHDYYSETCPYARLKLPENVYIFNSQSIDKVELPGMRAVVYGAAFTDEKSASLLEGFSAEKKDGWFNIMCIHGELNKPGSQYNPISEQQLAESGMDYVALGHDHKSSGALKAGSCYYSYPGCPEGKSFAESGEKTVNIVELQDDSCNIKTVSVASRKYEIMNVDISESDPVLAIHSQIPDDTVRDIYRIVLKGQSLKSPDLNDLYSKFSHMFFELQLKDETRLSRSIWEKAEEDSLQGLFLRKLYKRYTGTSDDAEKLKIEQAARWGLAAINKEEEVVIHGVK